MTDLAITNYSVERLIPYVRNARTHSDEQIAQIMASIAEFGFVNPILIDQHQGIIAGHGRLLAAQRLGMKEVPAIMLAHLSNPEHISRWMTENIITTIVDATVTIVFWYMFSATPGKMMLGIKIVDAETGQPPSTKQDIVRYLGYFVSIIPMLFGFLWVFWDKRAQGWHDKMANTVVVYKRSLPVSLRELSRKTKAASGAADSNAA